MTTSSEDPQHSRPARRDRRGGRVVAALGVVLVLAGAGAIYYHLHKGEDSEGRGEGKGGHGRGQNASQPVSVAEVAVKDIPLWQNGIGSAVPRNLVTLSSRVDGQLVRVEFVEGQMVKAGQMLAEIDPRPFQAALAQANGQLARDMALLANARVDLQRYRELWAQDSIPKQQLDTQEALVRQYEGTVENDRGIVANAKLQLDYTRITAPVSGRIGLRLVDPGNQVRASDTTGLTTIAQVQPMTVVFALPESAVPGIYRRLAKGDSLPAEAWDREQKNLLAAGKLVTIDNQIDPATGTIKLKAEFANADNGLFPNQFVNARILVGTHKGATVVPGAAIQRGSKGSFVYTVDGEGKVKSVPVTPGAVDGELVAVDGPLQAGERVVIDGADKLRDGGQVEVITPGQRQAPAKGGSPSQEHPKTRRKPG